MRSTLEWAGQVVCWVVILAVAAVLAAAVVVPRLSGATPYTVLTGSMQPNLPPGTLVVVRPADPEEIGIGDVITYQLESGEAAVVTHRVEEIRQSLGGEISYLTKGDANDTVDQEPVLPVQIRGELWYAVPYLGHVSELLTGRQRQTAVYLIGGGLIAYAAFMFTSAARDRRLAAGPADPDPARGTTGEPTGAGRHRR